MLAMNEARKDAKEEITREGQVLYLGSWVQGELNNVRQEIREIRLDIKKIEENMQQKMDNLRQEMKQDINSLRQGMDSLRQEIKQDINSLRQELKQEMKESDNKLREDIAVVRRDIGKLQYWAFGTFLSIIVAIVLHFVTR